VDVAGLVPDVLNRRACGTYMKIHVLERAVLSDMKPNRDRRRIPFLHLKIDVAHAAVKGEFGAVAEWSAGLWTGIGKMDHVFSRSFLKTRGIFAQNEYRPVAAVPDQPDFLPNEDRFPQPVSPFGDENHADSRRLLYAVDGLLQSVSVIADSVAMHAKHAFRQINGSRVFGAKRIIGTRNKRNRVRQNRKQKNDGA
jgi:hypothetical protein